jgi:ketosteroid isomerase-like protein
MSSVFHPVISIPPRDIDAAAQDGTLSAEQRNFVQALRERYAHHARAMEKGDLDEILTFFTEDVVWMGSGLPSRNGKAEIRAMFEEVAGTGTVRSESLAAYVNGDSGWNFVDYHVTPNDSAVSPWTFRTSFQWTRSDDQWRCNGVLCFIA